MKTLTGIILSMMFAFQVQAADSNELLELPPPKFSDKKFELKSEKEIPVSLPSEAKATTASRDLAKYFYAFAAMALLGVGTVFGVRKYFSKVISKAENTQIKIVTQHYLGPKKKLAIVRVAGESILIGVTEQNINMIKSLSLLDEDIPDVTAKDFKNELKSKESGLSENKFEEQYDEFSMSGVQDFVSKRLKNMRTLE
jgi:flagellar protein FliO/FliZ